MLEYRGLVLDAEPYYPDTVEGLLASPEVRLNLRPRLVRDGLFPGTAYLGGRTVTMTLDVVAWDEAGHHAALNALATALQVGTDEAPLRFQLHGVADGTDVFINARVSRWAAPISHEHYAHASTAVVEFVASDPRIYSDDEHVVDISSEVASEGITFPIVPPLVFGTGGVTGSVLILNAGSRPAPWVARILGPAEDVRLTNLDTGQYLQVDLGLVSGDVLVLDSEARKVTVNDALRYDLLANAGWFDLAPGLNELKLTVTGSDQASGTVTYRDAWI